MAIDRAQVKTIAVLARIKVEEPELDALANELNGILGWVEKLSRVNTDGIEPMTSVAAMTLPLRADKVADGGQREGVLKNAPDAVDGFYAVPKVVE